MFVKTISKGLEKFKRIRNYALECNLYLYFFLWQKLLKRCYFRQKISGVSRDFIYFRIIFRKGLTVQLCHISSFRIDSPEKAHSLMMFIFFHLLNNFLVTARQSTITSGNVTYHLSQPSLLTTVLILRLIRHHYFKSKFDTKYSCDCDLWLWKNNEKNRR